MLFVCETNNGDDWEVIEDESIKSVIPLAFETTFGARYLVTKNLGVYAEFGLAKAMLQFGLTAKL